MIGMQILINKEVNMGICKTAERMARIIEEIYEKKFGGKNRGRFQLSRSTFRKIAGRKKLRDSYIEEVADECLELGYVLVTLGDIIAIIEEGVMLNYRKVPKSVVNSYLIEDEDSDEYAEEEDYEQ